MPYFVGKLKSHMTKNHNEVFEGMISGDPVKGFWSKKANGPAVLWLIKDLDKMNFISKQNEAKNKGLVPASLEGAQQEEKKT